MTPNLFRACGVHSISFSTQNTLTKCNFSQLLSLNVFVAFFGENVVNDSMTIVHFVTSDGKLNFSAPVVSWSERGEAERIKIEFYDPN